MQLVIAPGGTVRCVYGEAIDIHAIGTAVIARGSHVEPNHEGHWFADLSPVQGPMLGPFQRRTEALRAEHAWLEANWLASETGFIGRPIPGNQGCDV